MKDNIISTNLDDFFIEFKTRTEEHWQDIEMNPRIYGFQFQAGTRWNPGLSDVEIMEFEKELDVQFPYDFKQMLRCMNGTDLPTVNIYGSSGINHSTFVGFYTFPQDIDVIKEFMRFVEKDREGITIALEYEDYTLPSDSKLVPIYGHRYIVCGSDLSKSTILSIIGTDAIVYGDSLPIYLLNELGYDNLEDMVRLIRYDGE